MFRHEYIVTPQTFDFVGNLGIIEGLYIIHGGI
jgi:hypothetical protein